MLVGDRALSGGIVIIVETYRADLVQPIRSVEKKSHVPIDGGIRSPP